MSWLSDLEEKLQEEIETKKEKALDEIEKEKDEIEEKRQKLEEEREKLESQLEDLGDEETDLEEQLSSIESEFAESDQDIEDQIEEAQREMRVKVAEDVLTRLPNLKVKTETGYIRPLTDAKEEELCEVRYDSAKKHLSKFERKCNVCALGSLLLSHVRVNNELTVDDVLNANGYHDDLLEYFEHDQLQLIESHFENNKKIDGCFYEEDDERLEAIMQNIVDNDGEFNP
jgi:hypothetical protein